MRHNDSEYLPVYWFQPVLPSWEQLQMRQGLNFPLFNKMQALTTYLVSADDGDTICEVAGGEARTTRVLIRMNDKRFTAGPNFDLVADIDLTDKREQLAFWDDRRKRKPKVCSMAPMCRSFGGWSRMNKVTNRGTWEHNYKSTSL